MTKTALILTPSRDCKLHEGESVDTSEIADGVLNGRSSLLGAMGWMFGLSFVLTLFLGWVPLIGPFIGPTVGGFIGGRRAGSPGTAVLAAVLPAVLLTLLMFALAGMAALLSHLPIVGAIAAIVAGAMGVIIIVHNLVLFLAALVGGATR